MEQEPIWEDRGNMPDFEREFWDEDDWERFMDEQDRKVDELVRLDEIFLNSGMESRDLELMGIEPCDKNCTECEERYSCWEYQEQLAEESRKATGAPERERKSRLDEFREIPVYGMCFEFGVAAMKWLHHIPVENRETEPAFRKLGENCGIPGAKIAGGHGMGYSPDTICGNVVKCKKAAAALTASIEALGVLSEREDTAEKASKLKQEAEAALKELRVRIEELRAEARRLHGKSD
jgi:hypothetical protein